MKKYTAAVIGCGRIGCEFDDNLAQRENLIYSHAGAYHTAPRVDLVALCDVDKYKVEKYAARYNTSLTTDYNQMLRIFQPDIVSVCTGPFLHYEIIKQCVSNGVKAIYCEKPIDISSETAIKTIKI